MLQIPICTKFSFLIYEKIKAGIFGGPQIRHLLNDQEFISAMKREKLQAWKAFSDVVKNFLGNMKSQNFSELVEKLLQAFHNLQCNMSVKVRFLLSHLDYFPENLGAFSEEQGERFHQDIKVMEKRYKGRWNIYGSGLLLKFDAWNFGIWTFPSIKKKKAIALRFCLILLFHPLC